MTDPAPAPTPGILSRIAPACAAWGVLGLVHALLGRFVPGTGATDPQLPSWARLTLGATELVLLAATIAAITAWNAAVVARLEPPGSSRRRRAAAAALRALPVAGLVFLWAASWMVFGATGRYIDQRTLGFFAENGSLVFQYFHAADAIGAACLILTGFAVPLGWRRIEPWVAARVSEGRRRSVARIGLLFVAFCALSAGVGEAARRASDTTVRDLLTKASYPLSKVYEHRRDTKTGPLSSALAGLLHSGGDPALVSSSQVEVVRRPQVPMEQVLAGVDRTLPSRPNVIVVVIDSVRADQLRVGGADRSVMPNLDALAQEGRAFVDVVTQSSHTQYATPCPLSSNYPLRSKEAHIYPDSPPYPRVFLWDVLKPLGYRTVLVSSQDHRWGNMIAYMKTGAVDQVIDPRGATVDDAITVDHAIRWIEEVGDAPFVMSLNLQNPHWPYPVPKGWPRRFGKEPHVRRPFIFYSPSVVEDVRNFYRDSVAYSDEQLGRVLETLKRRGIWDRTIVVVTADHGHAFLEHGFAGHASKLFGEVTRVPLVFRGPGVPPGVDRRPGQIIDVPPSVLGLLGLPSHPSFQGADLFAAQFPEVRSRYIVAHTTLAMQYAVERGGFKLIHDQELAIDVLYDLKRDPGETADVSAQHPVIARDLAWRLNVWRQAQLEYYGSADRLRTEYPPLLVER